MNTPIYLFNIPHPGMSGRYEYSTCTCLIFLIQACQGGTNTPMYLFNIPHPDVSGRYEYTYVLVYYSSPKPVREVRIQYMYLFNIPHPDVSGRYKYSTCTCLIFLIQTCQGGTNTVHVLV